MTRSIKAMQKQINELQHELKIAKMICAQAEGKDCLIGPAAFR